jgi:PAS domain S-box-containing protein
VIDSNRSEKLSCLGVVTAIALGLYLGSLYSYLLFHSLIEITTIAIGFTLFILTWNARRFLTNNILSIIGIGYAFIALIDLLHTLAYKGMNVFPGFGANLPTQLWIAARYLQAVTLCAAPLFVGRRVDNRAIFGIYAAAVSVLVAMVYSGNFPDCFIEGKGLTTFKISSEYVITALLLTALYLLYRKRKYFNDRVFFLTLSSIACTVVSEISFTAYVSVYGVANLVGHFAKLAAFYLIYRAILVTGLREPVDLFFRELKQAEEALRNSQDTLEEKVRARTAELRASEERYRSLIHKVQTAIVLHDGQGRILDSNPLAQELLGLSADQLLGKTLIDPEWHFLREDGSVLPVTEYPASLVLSSRQPLRYYVTGINRPDRDAVMWVLVNGEPEYADDGEIAQVIVSFVDITERRRIEDALFFVAQRGWLTGADNFFDALAQYLGENLGVDYVVIDRIDENPEIAETVALYAKGAIVPNMRYALKGTPCENVMGRRLCVYPEEVQRLFPEDTLLAEMGAESYFGIPLWDASGRPIGLIALMDSKPLLDTASATHLLQLVAVRAAAELARDRSDRILQMREHEFRTLANNLPDNIVRYDREGRTVYVNPLLEKTLGAAAADMIGKQVREIHPDGSYEAYAEALDATLASGENREIEFILPIPGKVPIVHQIRMIAERDEHDEVTGVLAIGHDITERKRAEEDLFRLNAGLEVRVESRTHDLEVKRIELEESQQALMNIVEDLNEKTSELEQANSRLQELDRLKSMFIASMSHELRTPLNSVIGFSSVLLKEWVGPINAEQKENLAIILRSGKHLLNLINDVIDVSKIEAGKIESTPEEFDLHDLVSEAVSLVKKEFGEKGLALRVAAAHQQMRTDRRRLLQCVLNLLSNAVKFTEQGGVTVETRIERSPGASPESGFVEISVTDTGTGIRGEDIGKMFQPFVRLASPLQATVPGTGLGLYLTRKLAAEVLKGDILLTSEYGKGSRFTIKIPVGVP